MNDTNEEHSDSRRDAETEAVVEAPLHGLLAEYDNPGALIAAAKKVRDAGYAKWDTFTPFPVHGIDRAMGIRMTRLPWIVMAAAMVGLGTAIWMQWWMNAVDYPWIVSGKPFWSIPANVPIMFELTVLFSAITALVAMLVLNGLPLPSHPLDLKRRFARVTDDRFFLLIQVSDPKFDEQATRELLQSTAPAVLDDLPEDRTSSDKLPRGVVYGLIVLATASLLPFAYFAMARETKTRDPRIHAIPDMDWQPKYKAQRKNTFFADDRAMREPVPGTIAVGALDLDDHLHRGKQADGAWARGFPEQIAIDEPTMQRGQQRYDVFCAPCHGLSGDGDGMVSKRAEALEEGTWVPPTNLRQDYLRQQPVGQLYNTIAHGIRNVPPYGPQIDVSDRWAVVLYLRALQRTQTAASDLTDAERGALK
jgi:mono/diheme cytochrome c family protein